jgi:ligand-binding sensor protein
MKLAVLGKRVYRDRLRWHATTIKSTNTACKMDALGLKITVGFSREDVMSVKSIRSDAEWTELLSELYSQTGMVASLTDPDGKILMNVGERNSLCSRVRENPESLKFVCSQTASAMTSQLLAMRQPVIDVCEGGLWRLVVPVLLNGKVVGQVSACGLAVAGEEPDSFVLSRQLGESEEQINNLLTDLPTANEVTLESMAARLMLRVNGK